MDKLRRVIPGNRRIFVRNFMCVLLAVVLFSCVVIAVYQHQIHQMILSDIGVLNLSTLEKNIQTIDGVMLSLRELAYTVSSEQSMQAFFAGTPQVDAMRRRFEENVDQAEQLLAYYRLSSPYVENVYLYSPRMGRLISSTKRGTAGSDVLLNEAWHRAAAQSGVPGKISVFFQRWRGSYPLSRHDHEHHSRYERRGGALCDGGCGRRKAGRAGAGQFSGQGKYAFVYRRFLWPDASEHALLSAGRERRAAESLRRFEGEAAGFSQMTLIEGEE